MMVLGHDRSSGRLFLANDEGGRLDFDEVDAPHIALMLAEECHDNDMRAFVADSWSPSWEKNDG